MSEAKKCDVCKDLYEVAGDDNKVTVQELGTSYNTRGKPKVIGFLKLFRDRGFAYEETEPIDHCQSCTEGAVRRFMAKFHIPERKGESFQCRIRTRLKTVYFEEGPALSKEDNNEAQDKNRAFFAGFDGKRVRITVEVL